jgi:ParB family chromosome partitioning protein
MESSEAIGAEESSCVIKETTPQGTLEMQIFDDVHREALNLIELALAYRRLMQEFELGISEVAKRVGKSVTAVSNSIRLLSLPDAIKDAMVAGVISEGQARALLPLGDPRLMLDVFKAILGLFSRVDSLSEELVRKVKGDI